MSKITDKQIEDWKAAHGEIFKLEFEDGKEGFLKKPSRKILKAAMAKMQTDPLSFVERILTDCWLGGDELVRTEDAYFFGAAEQLEGLMENKKAELKKL
ncbi:hypothetical protein CO230_08675 [Chryseobacterium sp. 6424]|uniref:hypothetical protein n=1 Tax=Chryseobacterium sp. 6424 TaxID=2039166 RepID=UPI000EFD1880|nr:hypothetical protein [Chryseobacterium sp. 6424]AYO58188.1 hypothetical protein CO230_08675 [Chryseobacterium sp. 6424]